MRGSARCVMGWRRRLWKGCTCCALRSTLRGGRLGNLLCWMSTPCGGGAAFSSRRNWDATGDGPRYSYAEDQTSV